MALSQRLRQCGEFSLFVFLATAARSQTSQKKKNIK